MAIPQPTNRAGLIHEFRNSGKALRITDADSAIISRVLSATIFDANGIQQEIPLIDATKLYEGDAEQIAYLQGLIGGGGSADALLFTAQALANSQHTQALNNLSLIPLSGKVIHVSKATTATDTRTNLSVYDSTKPFATLEAARSAAGTGDRISVGPSNASTPFTVSTQLFKPGVHWHFDNSYVIKTTTDDVSIFDDSADGANADIICTVSGSGVFIRDASATTASQLIGVVHVTRPGSAVFFTCQSGESIEGATHVGLCFAFTQTAGYLSVNADQASGLGGGIWWEGGEFYGRINEVFGDGINEENPTGVVYCINNAAGARMWLETQRIESTSILGNAITVFSTNAQVWINAKEIKSRLNCIGLSGAAKVYVTAQKLTMTDTVAFGTEAAGVIVMDNGELWVTCQKMAGRPLVHSGGELHLTCPDWDDDTGDPDTVNAIHVSGNGLAFLELGYWKSVTSNGLNMLAGTTATVRLSGVIDTSSVASASPVTKDAGTLALNANAVLIAHATRDGIEAATAQAVTSYGASMNKAPDANVTVTGPYTVNGSLKQAGALTGTTGTFSGVVESEAFKTTGGGHLKFVGGASAAAAGTVNVYPNGTLKTGGNFEHSPTTAGSSLKLVTTGDTLSSDLIVANIPGANGTPVTLVTTASTQTLTNKTLTSPTLTTPVLGAATATSLATSGNMDCGNLFIVSYGINVNSQFRIRAFTADGVARFTNNAENDFNRIQLGGTTSSFPAIKRSGTSVAIRLADDSADASLTALNLTASGTVTIGGGTAIAKSATFTAALTQSINATTEYEQSITATGVAAGDTVALDIPSQPQGIVLAGVRCAADAVLIKFYNTTAGALSLTGTAKVRSLEV